jgi:hypothetical protein
MKKACVTKTKSKKLTGADKTPGGKVGGTSKAPKTPIPKAKLGMIAGDPPVQNMSEVTVTATKGKQTRASKAKPKAMYGMAMKPGMMRKGGSKKSC